MDSAFLKEVDKRVPQFNPLIANGLVVEQMKEAEDYVDRLWRQAAKDFPPGLVYLKSERCDPNEVYQIMALRNKNRKGKSVCELSETNVYLMKYMLILDGVPLEPVYLYLPHIKEAGIITIKGSNFAISPVLADMSLSIGTDDIFIYMNKSRITFKRLMHAYNLVHESGFSRESEYVPWCRAHNSSVKPTSQNRKTTNAHYLFCKFGVTESFRTYGGAEIVIGNNELNTHNYPIDTWTICTSVQIKPAGRTGRYFPSTIRLAIKNVHVNHMTKSMIAAFFYLVDHFPEHITAEGVDNIDLWRLLLGYCIFKPGDSNGRVIDKINTHFNSVDGFIDSMVKVWLQKDDVMVEDIYDFFSYIIKNFSSLIAQNAKSISSLEGKRLISLRYVLFNITDGIFNTLFELQRQARKGKLDISAVNDIFRSKLKPNLITRINQKHAEVSSVSSASDCYAFKITNNMVLQTSMSGTASSKTKGKSWDETKALDSTLADIASFNNLPKRSITGHGVVSMYCRLGTGFKVERNEQYAPLLKRVQAIVCRV